MANSINKKSLSSDISQCSLRVLALVATVVAASVMWTNKQHTLVYGIPADARFSYSSAFKFFVAANMIACLSSIISMFLAFLFGLNPANFFYLFLHDLIITILLMAGCAATTAIGFVGKYGNSHTGWMAICDHFGKFCNKVTIAATMSYIGVVIYLILTIISANKSRKIEV